MTSGRPDLALLLSGTARGPRFGFEVNVRIRDYVKRGWECNAFLHFLFLEFFCPTEKERRDERCKVQQEAPGPIALMLVNEKCKKNTHK